MLVLIEREYASMDAARRMLWGRSEPSEGLVCCFLYAFLWCSDLVFIIKLSSIASIM